MNYLALMKGTTLKLQQLGNLVCFRKEENKIKVGTPSHSTPSMCSDPTGWRRREQLTFNTGSEQTFVPSAEMAREAASCAADLDPLMLPQELTEQCAYTLLFIEI